MSKRKIGWTRRPYQPYKGVTSAPVISRRARRSANRMLVVGAAIGALVIGAILWHVADEVLTDLVV